MEDRVYHIRISPENVKGDLFKVDYTGGTYDISPPVDPCCVLTATTVTGLTTGFTYVYSSMTDVVSGGTDGTSLLTGLTIPVFLSQNTIDVGYYSAFDGAIQQKDVMLNFIFSATSGSPYQYYFYNTSELEMKKYLDFSTYQLDWGDNSPIVPVTTISPNYYQHTYPGPGEWIISFSGMSPWGYNVVRKKVITPFTGTTIPNPQGEAFFYPSGGNWSATPISYNYIFSGDSICDVDSQVSSNYTTLPIIVSGYSESTVSDLRQYGPASSLYDGKYKLGVKVTGSTGVVGTFHGPSIDGLFTGYTINGVDYYDYNDGFTIFVVKSSGYTADWLSCTGLTKNEALINAIDELEIQSNVFIERGKISGLEALERLGEVDNMGDLEKYGYGFFKVINV